MSIWLVVGAASFLGGFVHGLAGFGSILVALPFFAMVLTIQTAVPLAVLMAMIINTTLVRSERKHVAWREVVQISIWMVPGILLGSYLLQSLGEQALHLILGIMLLSFVATRLYSPRKAERRLSHISRAATGFTAGIFGGSTGTSGPPIIVYCLMNAWPKEEARATMVGTLFISNVIIIAHQIAVGLTTLQVLKLFAFCVPFIACGMFVGRRSFGHINDALFANLSLHFWRFLPLWKSSKAFNNTLFFTARPA